MSGDELVTLEVRMQTAAPDNPAAVAWRAVSEKLPVPADDQARTVDEWLVTGNPGPGYPPYRFVLRSDVYATPEAAARMLCEASDWTDGPHLAHRTVTYSDWEQVT